MALSRAQNALFIIGAGEFYRNLEIELPYMDKKGSKKRNVYQDIIGYLERKGSLYESDCVIDYNKASSILSEYNRKHKNKYQNEDL